MLTAPWILVDKALLSFESNTEEMPAILSHTAENKARLNGKELYLSLQKHQ